MSQFDHCIDRTKTASFKWSLKQHNYDPNTLPMWVADMDFQTAPGIIEALQSTVADGVYGYTRRTEEYNESVLSWLSHRHQYQAKSSWLLTNYGVVMAIAIAIQAYTSEEDSVLIQTPVYHPFANTVKANNRQVVTSSLKYEHHSYSIDFEDFEEKIIANKVKLFILCNPHNPVGRVFNRDELQQLAAICVKHHVIVVSDEIHSDFVYKPYKHIVFSSISPEIEQQTILCTSASKTFNLAALQVSNTIIANDHLRKKYQAQLDKISFHNANDLGLKATQAAYQTGEAWLEELLVYLKRNIDYVTEFFKENLPQFPVIETQGTYLMWIDFSALNLSQTQLNDFFLNEVGLWLNAGDIFGEEGTNFQRINVATQYDNVVSACQRIKDKIDRGGF